MPTARALSLSLTIALLPTVTLADDWPQWRGPERDGVWRETGVLETFPEEGLPTRWSTPIGPGYSGPTVADGRVYVSDRQRKPEPSERVLCLDWKSGEVLWAHSYSCDYQGISYDAGPRCSVLIDDGRAYSLGSAGHLYCLDAAKGDVLWQHDLREEYEIRMPIWGISASPIIEGNLLIVPVSGAEGAYLVAFDRKTGEESWAALDDRGNYSAPIVIDQAGERVLVCMTGDRIVGVAPRTGELYWEQAFKPKNMPLGVPDPILYEDQLFFSTFYDGSMLLKLDTESLGVELVWKRCGPNEIKTDALQGIISTALIRDDHVYGVDSYGQLRCLRLVDGERVWEDLTAVPKARWSTIHFVQNGERTWMFNERGELLIGELSPMGFKEISRAKIIEPTEAQLGRRGGVCWSHPAYAYRHVFARNDERIVCVDLEAK